MLQRELLYAALGTGFTCLATVLGAGMVFFFRKDIGRNTQRAVSYTHLTLPTSASV